MYAPPNMKKRIKQTDQNKPWAKKKMQQRAYSVESREKLPSFFIVCEGMNTEPDYFRSFPLGNACVKSFGLGHTKTQLVQAVLGMIQKDATLKDQEVWVVFDMDRSPDQEEKQSEDFNQAIALARENGIQVAYSNDAFELWFILHYQPQDAQWLRDQYYQKLSELWGCHYEREGKASSFCKKTYQRLQNDERADQQKALRRAEQIHHQQTARPFAEQNPCTTVYQLVAALNRYL
jgi:hypothetical protein